MNTKERLYAVIGGCVGAVLTMLVCSFLPLGAQSQGNRLGYITCTGLKVIDSAGRTMVDIGYDEMGGGKIGIWANDSMHLRQVFLAAGNSGGGITCFARVNTSDELLARGSVGMGFGGGDPEAGQISIMGGLLRPRVIMEVDEHGGRVNVYGKGKDNDTTRAVICVNEYGNGAVGTWDKNGYRLATLK